MVFHLFFKRCNKALCAFFPSPQPMFASFVVGLLLVLSGCGGQGEDGGSLAAALINDSPEVGPPAVPGDGPDPSDPTDFKDSDGDGVSDQQEKECGTNILLTDTDDDGLSDYIECLVSPECNGKNKKDTDGDGHSDFQEWKKFGTCKNNDWDQDGSPDDIDCGPNNPNRYPGAPDPPGDGVDTDCMIQKKTCIPEDDPKLNDTYCLNPDAMFPFQMGDNLWSTEDHDNSYCVRAKMIPGPNPESEYKEAKMKVVVHRAKSKNQHNGHSDFLAYEFFGEKCGPSTWDGDVNGESVAIDPQSQEFDNLGLGDHDLCEFFVDKNDPIFEHGSLPTSANNYLRVRRIEKHRFDVRYRHTMLDTFSDGVGSSTKGNLIDRTCSMGD